MIEFKNVSYTYGKSAHNALRDVNATMAPGIHLLLGENGAGKTTLLHIVAGLRFPTAGECTIDGRSTALREPEVLSHCFMLADEMELPAPTINKLKAIHACFYPTFSADNLADNLAAFGMDGNEKLRDMSLGTRKKAYLAYALALNTKVLLMDEPTNGLDIAARKTLRRLLGVGVGPERTVIVSTHNVGDLEVLYDGLTVLRRGELLLSMTTEEILSRLSFISESAPHPDALYVERDMGVVHSIVANKLGEPATHINFPLLYMALQTPQGSAILNILKNN